MLEIVPNRALVVGALYLALLRLEPESLTALQRVTITVAEQAEADLMLAAALGDDGYASRRSAFWKSRGTLAVPASPRWVAVSSSRVIVRVRVAGVP